MKIDGKLLALLVCPACRGTVTAIPDGSGVACERCDRSYPVRDGIPVLLVDESTAPQQEPRP